MNKRPLRSPQRPIAAGPFSTEDLVLRRRKCSGSAWATGSRLAGSNPFRICLSPSRRQSATGFETGRLCILPCPGSPRPKKIASNHQGNGPKEMLSLRVLRKRA